MKSAFSIQNVLLRAKITVRQKILGLALLVMALCGVIVVFMRLEIAAYSQRDDMRGVSVAVLNAHRFERDFITTRNRENVLQFDASVRIIDSLTKNYDDSPTHQLQQQLQSYTASFSLLTSALEARGLNENSGAEGSFRASVHAIESLINNAQELHLLNTMLQVRRSVPS